MMFEINWNEEVTERTRKIYYYIFAIYQSKNRRKTRGTNIVFDLGNCKETLKDVIRFWQTHTCQEIMITFRY